MDLPARLIAAFDGDKDLLAWAATLRPSWSRYIAGWVEEPKSEEARQRRADDMAERMMLTMEAEQQLPPQLDRRLRATRDGLAGWQRMTENCRRTWLFVWFGTKSEEAREKQTIRILDACVAKGRAKQVKSAKAAAE